MKKFFSAIAASANAADDAPNAERFEVAGKAVTCVHCGGEEFIEGRAQLNTAGLTFLGLDWANRTASTLACVGCGRVEWYLADPEQRA